MFVSSLINSNFLYANSLLYFLLKMERTDQQNVLQRKRRKANDICWWKVVFLSKWISKFVISNFHLLRISFFPSHYFPIQSLCCATGSKDIFFCKLRHFTLSRDSFTQRILAHGVKFPTFYFITKVGSLDGVGANCGEIPRS